MLASEAKLEKEGNDTEFDKATIAQHKQMLASMAGKVMIRSAGHFHAKTVIADWESNPMGMLLTANLTKEALERNEEIAVRLQPQEVREVAAILRWAMWEESEHELTDRNGRFMAVKPLGEIEFPKLFTTLIATSSKTTSIRDEVLRLIDKAKREIIVSSFGWDVSHNVVRRLVEKAKAGVVVTVLARVRPSAMPALLDMANAGARVVGFKWLHAKSIWVDSHEACVMLANLEPTGLDHGFELGVRLVGERAAVLYGILQQLIGVARWRLEPKPVMGSAIGKVQLWRDNKLDETNIVARQETALNALTAQSSHDLDLAKPEIPKAGDGSIFAHEVLYHWTINSPLLKKGSKEMFHPPDETVGGPKNDEKTAGRRTEPIPYSPRVFKEPSGRLVVGVVVPDEIENAIRQMRDLHASAIVRLESK